MIPLLADDAPLVVTLPFGYVVTVVVTLAGVIAALYVRGEAKETTWRRTVEEFTATVRGMSIAVDKLTDALGRKEAT